MASEVVASASAIRMSAIDNVAGSYAIPIVNPRDHVSLSSIRMTADVYGHILDPDRQAAAEIMNATLWSENPSSQ